jgi:hypothetical protein
MSKIHLAIVIIFCVLFGIVMIGSVLVQLPHWP